MSDLRKNRKSALIVTLVLVIIQICSIIILVSSWIDLGRALCKVSCDSYKLNGGGIAVLFYSQFWITTLAFFTTIISWFIQLLLLIYYLLNKKITVWFATISFTEMLLMLYLFKTLMLSDRLGYIPK